MRWEEPHHPGPGLQLVRHSIPLSPTLQHDLPLQPPLHPLGPVRVPVVPEAEGAQPPDETAATETSEAAPAAAPPAQGPGLPEDADDLRGSHFKLLRSAVSTWALILVPAVAAGVVLAAAGLALIGVLAFAAIILGGIVVAWLLADRRAADDFFTVYASRHELELGGRGDLPPVTPLLLRGDKRYAKRSLSGPLAPDCAGILALYTYEERQSDGQGGSETNYYNYTVGLTSVPECTSRVPELYCQRKFGLRSLQKLEDVFRRSKQRVKLESEALDDKYEIFSRKDQDATWLRQLFAPSFIVWLTDSAPPKFAFELANGNLCCYVHGHKEDSADLETLSAATATIARRLREESAE